MRVPVEGGFGCRVEGGRVDAGKAELQRMTSSGIPRDPRLVSLDTSERCNVS